MLEKLRRDNWTFFGWMSAGFAVWAGRKADVAQKQLNVIDVAKMPNKGHKSK